MKTAFAFAALASAVYAQQDFPTCAGDCINDLLTGDNGCNADPTCLCKKADTLFGDVDLCVVSNCTPKDQGEVFRAVTGLCESVGVTINIGDPNSVVGEVTVGGATSHTGMDHGSTGSTDSTGGSSDGASLGDATSHTGMDHGSTGSTGSTGGSSDGASLGDATSHTGMDHGSTGSTGSTGGSSGGASLGGATSDTTFEGGSGSTGSDAGAEDGEDGEDGAWLGQATSDTTFEHGSGHGSAPASSQVPSASSGGNKTTPPTATPPSPTKPPAFTGEGARTVVSGVAAFAAVVLALATL